jgi:hypothetical protein
LLDASDWGRNFDVSLTVSVPLAVVQELAIVCSVVGEPR